MIPSEFKARINRFLVFAAVLTAAFSVFLVHWVRFSLEDNLFSYTLIIPGVVLWLIWQGKDGLRFEYSSMAGLAIGVGALGIVALGASFLFTEPATAHANAVSVRIAAYVLLLIAGALLVLGGRFVQQIIFPLTFLLFMAPFPPALVNGMEVGLQNASAVVSGWFFTLIGLSHVQDGRIFQLPNITIEVARECSGIRSTIVLFLTGLIAAYLFLNKNWQRTLFCALIIPLGIARNGFRIVTIGWLCTNYGPEMIHSPIHHRGGPVFFALSLVPLFVLVWLFRRVDRRANKPGERAVADKPGERPEPSEAV